MKRLHIPAAVLALVHDEERAGNLVIWGAAAVGAACLVAAVLAIAFMK
jgi:hypothetical protein